MGFKEAGPCLRGRARLEFGRARGRGPSHNLGRALPRTNIATVHTRRTAGPTLGLKLANVCSVGSRFLTRCQSIHVQLHRLDTFVSCDGDPGVVTTRPLSGHATGQHRHRHRRCHWLKCVASSPLPAKSDHTAAYLKSQAIILHPYSPSLLIGRVPTTVCGFRSIACRTGGGRLGGVGALG